MYDILFLVPVTCYSIGLNLLFCGELFDRCFCAAWCRLKKLTGALMADESNDGPSSSQELDVPSQLLRGVSYVPRS